VEEEGVKIRLSVALIPLHERTLYQSAENMRVVIGEPQLYCVSLQD
jgi:hypothetical protein